MKKLYSIAAMAFAGIAINAATLTPGQALNRALAGDAGANGPAKAPASAYSLVATRFADKVPAVYVFSSEGRFLITSADDRVRSCLGYGDGMIDAANIPCNVEAWLQGYADEIAAYLGSAPEAPAFTATVDRPPMSTTQRAAIAPLCSARWDQEAPYNNMCPLIGRRRAMTGCAATAMAQVMKMHRHPQRGTGSHSYVYKGETYSADFSQSEYRWDDMLDIYMGAAIGTEAQRNAVALLMYDCGVSLDMMYDTSASGAYDHLAPYSLTEYFGYDPESIFQIYRDGYTDQNEWDEAVYESLEQGYPVLYTGQAPSGGHSFVCDGYSSAGLFHINWGWSGYCDGYFPLSALEPAGQGIGGAAGGYNSNQSAIVGVRPTPAGVRQRAFHNILGSGKFAYNGWNFTLTEYVANYCPVASEFYLGVVAIDSDGKETYFMNDFLRKLPGYDPNLSNWWYTAPAYNPEVKGLADGVYRVYPAIKVEGDNPRRMALRKSTQPMLWLKVEGERYRYTESAPAPDCNLSLASFDRREGDGPVVPGVMTDYKVVVSNSGPEAYDGYIYITVDRELSYNAATAVKVNIPVGQTVGIDFSTALSSGIHYLYVGDMTLNPVSGTPYEFTVSATGGAMIVAEAIDPIGEFYSDSPVKFDVTVRNTGSADYEGTVYLAIRRADSDEQLFEQTVTAAAGATANWISPEFTPKDFEAGEYYVRLLDADKNPTSNYSNSFYVQDRPHLRLASVTPVSGTTPGTVRLDLGLVNEAETKYDNFVDFVAVDADGAPAWSTQYGVLLAGGQRGRIVLQNVELGAGTYTFTATDISGHALNGSGIEFTVKATGIDAVDAADAVRVEAAGGVIAVSGAAPGMEVRVISASGAVIARAVADGEGCAMLRTGVAGVYIVTVGPKAFKVAF